MLTTAILALLFIAFIAGCSYAMAVSFQNRDRNSLAHRMNRNANIVRSAYNQTGRRTY